MLIANESSGDGVRRPLAERLRGRLAHLRLRTTLRRARLLRRPPTPALLLEGRRTFDEVGQLMGVPEGAVLTDDRVPDGPRVQWVDFRHLADDPEQAPTVFYVHGGAYAMGSIMASRHAASTHLRAIGARGLVVEYRLAPEHPFPAGLDDVDAAWRWLVERVDPSQVVALGESAGGGLLVAAMCRWRDEGLPLPAGAVTISAWANLAHDTESYVRRRRRDLALDVRLLRHAADAYAGTTPRDEPALSPVLADLRGLPPLLLAVGTEEVVWDDTLTLHANALLAGVEADLLVGDGQLHCWPGYADRLPEARDAVARIAEFVRRRTTAA